MGAALPTAFDAMNSAEPLRLQFDLFELDERQARLTRSGRPLALPPKAFDVLCALARQPDQLVTKEALLDAVWGHQYVSESVLKTTISELRAALGDAAKQPRYIETAARRGYRFIARAEPLGESPGPFAAAPREPADGTMRPEALIGRQAARHWLHAAWREALAGRRQITWLAGEAGIGKTTLIQHVAAELGPASVAQGQCVEQHGAGEPYLPVLEALASLCRADAALPALLRSVAPTWLLQLPWLSSEAERETLRSQLAGIGQQRMLRELGELLDQYTQQRPLLLVTEDLHWSDQATLRAIDHVARRRAPARLMWLASFRLAEVIAADHPLKALRHELRLHRLAGELMLDTFSEREVAEYIAARCPAQPDTESLALALHARTDGLPLFLANVVDELMMSPDAAGPLRAGAAPEAWKVPESLAGVVERQIDRLSAEERDLLAAASVCGVEFDGATLADVLQRDARELGQHCDELVRRQQWLSALTPDRLADGSICSRYAFRHALYRQVFYQRIGMLARAQWHGRAALSLEHRRSDGPAAAAAQIALHHELGHDLMAAARHYAVAAENALNHFAPAEAMSLTGHALDLLSRCAAGPQRLALEVAVLGPRSIAASQVLGVTAPQTRQTFERLDQLCEQLPDHLSRALELGFGWVLFVCGEYQHALAHAARKLELAEQRGDRVLLVAACNLYGATLSYQGHLAEARAWLERGLAACAGMGERLATALTVVDLEVSLRSRLSQVLVQLGAVDQGRHQIAAAHARVDRLGQPYARRLVLIFESFLELRLEHPERVQALGEAMQRIASEHALAQADGPSRWLRGWALAQRGQPLAGHALILEGYAMDVGLGVLRGRSGVLGYAARALILAARWHDAQQQLDEALSLAARMGERLHLPELLLLQGQIALGLGEAAAARASMQAARREAASQQALWLEASALAALCETAGAGDEDLAALAAARRRLLEGLDTALVVRIDGLLRERAPDRNPTAP